MKQQSERFAWLLVLPTFAVMLVILALPLLFSLYLSFNKWDLTVVPSRIEWIGLTNYLRVLRDSETWRAIQFTFLYTVASVAGSFVIGLVLALLLNRAPVGRGLFAAILTLPMMMTPIVSGLVWRLLYNPTFGDINHIFGLGNLSWLGEIHLARIAVIVTTIWQSTPFIMILLLAGLQSLPEEPFEAALIDGASRWQSLRYVTLPLLMPTMMVALLIRTIFEFRAFDVIWILTTGGPAGSTETLSLLNFRISFRHFAVGEGAALSWIMLVITALISFGYIYFLYRARPE
ncbi:MAG: sugar ABC transporter permease [Caldilineaceae bacterium]|nr:sugar ABC transporter permease [Caldilineaceae bacterium]